LRLTRKYKPFGKQYYPAKKEKKKMRKKIILGTILMLSALIVTVIAAVGPALAHPRDNSIDLYGTGAHVNLTLPPPNVGPPPLGVPAHPTTIGFIVADYNRRSEGGAFDLLFVGIWVQSINSFFPIAQVYDTQVPAWAKQLFNSTGAGNPLYYETSAGVVRSNLIQVGDKELEVWTESSWTQFDHGYKSWNGPSAATLKVNLTRSVFINYTYSNPLIGNLSFTLPPLTLEFHETGEGWPEEDTNTVGKWVQFEKSTKVPAWVEVVIPAWCRTTSFQVAGSIAEHMTEKFTPPA
jgi:hypothetical protein